MRVLLINPPRFNELIGKNPAIVERHRGFNPPLGLLYLAGYLEHHGPHHVEVIDAQPKEWSYGELAQEVRHRKFDVCGITAMTFTLIDVRKTCEIVRTEHPETTIVLGGSHVHLFPEETVRWPQVDFLIQGEGEIAFLEFLRLLPHRGEWQNIPGIVFEKGDGTVFNGGVAPSTVDLDSLGFPARDKLDPSLYNSLLGRKNVVTTMFTSRGCPFRCTFCDRPVSPVISGFRWRSASHIADEMEMCLQMGISEAFIYDDTFTVRKDRVHELCDEIDRRKICFRWDVRAHVNTVDQDLLKHMAEAGCDRIHFGVESGNDRMLRVIRKNTTVEKIRRAFRMAREAGLELLAYFMIGQQTERAEDVGDTIRLAKELDPDYVHFTVFCPYPGTEIYQRGLESGFIKSDVWRELAMDPRPGLQLPVWEENFTRLQLQKMLVQCYKSFYLRPRYIARRFSQVGSLGEFARKAKAGLAVLGMSPNQKLFTRNRPEGQ